LVGAGADARDRRDVADGAGDGAAGGGHWQRDGADIIENLRQRGLRQGIEGGEELKRLLKIELKQVLDGVGDGGCGPGGFRLKW